MNIDTVLQVPWWAWVFAGFPLLFVLTSLGNAILSKIRVRSICSSLVLVVAGAFTLVAVSILVSIADGNAKMFWSAMSGFSVVIGGLTQAWLASAKSTSSVKVAEAELEAEPKSDVADSIAALGWAFVILGGVYGMVAAFV